MNDLGPLIGVALASLLYLILDFFVVLKHFSSMRTASFWVLWVVVGTANVLTFYWISGSVEMDAKFGPAKMLATILFSTIGSAAILQSMTFSLGDKEVLDISRFVKNLRAAVLEDVAKNQAKRNVREAMAASQELAGAYRNDIASLRSAWTSARSLEGVSIERIASDLEQMDADAARLGIPVSVRIAQRLAQADPAHARDLIVAARIARQRLPHANDQK